MKIDDGKKFNFDSFSNLEFYKTVNSNLLDLADINTSTKILDLGCGNGGITEMILSKVKDVSKIAIYAVDSSSAAISLALKRFSNRKDVIINYIQSEAQNLHENLKDKVEKGTNIAQSVMGYINEQYDPAMNWEDAEYCIKKWNGPMALKGVMSVEDAKRAIYI